MVVVTRIDSISYVQTTIGQAEVIVGEDRRGGTELPPDLTVWLIVAYGQFQRNSRGNLSSVYSTSYAIVVKDTPDIFALLSRAEYNLASAGVEIVIPPGVYPELDVLRAPTIACATTPVPQDGSTASPDPDTC